MNTLNLPKHFILVKTKNMLNQIQVYKDPPLSVASCGVQKMMKCSVNLRVRSNGLR